jgi:hypothetical protein
MVTLWILEYINATKYIICFMVLETKWGKILLLYIMLEIKMLVSSQIS